VAGAIYGKLFTAKTLIRVAVTAMSLNSIAIAHSASPYQTPGGNYYQNNCIVTVDGHHAAERAAIVPL
jgi:hypothetical protein